MEELENVESDDRQRLMPVKCSCGKTAHVTWNESQQKFVCLTTTWKFITGPKSIGWTCGEEGHTSAANE